MFKHTLNMVVKTITITENAYNTLKRMKHGDESFSEVITRIGSGKKSIVDFLGLLKDSESSAEELHKRTKEVRKRVSESFRRRHANFGHISSN